MDIIYSSNKLRKTFTRPDRLIRKYGPRQATQIKQRLYELDNVETLAKMHDYPSARCHELKGNRAGQLSLDLRHPYRLIIEPANDPIPRKDHGGLDWSQVTRVRILGVEDTHG